MSDKTPQEQTQEILGRFADSCDPNHNPESVLSRIMGLVPQKPSPPDDMPAIDKIKLYARSGYHLHHIGTDEDFERVWEEAFGKESKFKFLVDARRNEDRE